MRPFEQLTSAQARQRQLHKIPGGPVVGTAMWAAAKLRVAQWNAVMKSKAKLQQVQEQTLLEHMRFAQETEFGRKHGFKGIRSHQDFARQVPLRSYADFENDL